MTRTKIINQPTRLSDMLFEDYDTVPNDRQQGKVQRLELKRWRKLKHQLI